VLGWRRKRSRSVEFYELNVKLLWNENHIKNSDVHQVNDEMMILGCKSSFNLSSDTCFNQTWSRIVYCFKPNKVSRTIQNIECHKQINDAWDGCVNINTCVSVTWLFFSCLYLKESCSLTRNFHKVMNNYNFCSSCE
jgi:hypothetical protein